MPIPPARRRRTGPALSVVALVGLLVGLFAGLVGLAGPGRAGAQTTVQWSPAHPADFPDPSVMLYSGTYYAFATQTTASPSRPTVNIQTSTSTDGVHWTASNIDALPQLPVWARPGDTWGPTVAFNGTEFVMYYSATQAADGAQCIGLAVASAPEGPYVDDSSAPVICQDGLTPGVPNNGGSIDPDIFIDQGAATLIWKSEGNRIGLNTYIWSQPLAPDLLTLTGNPTQILASDQPWQSGIIEGPDMVDRGGTDYLFYAGGVYTTANYAIGYAVCPKGPLSPCTDAASNPILTTASGLSGPGGPSTFLSPAGQLELAFSAWQGTTIGYMSCGIRPMFVSTVSFSPAGVPALASAVPPGDAVNPSCPPAPGYWQVGADGGVFTFGAARFYGSTGSLRLNKPVVGMAATPDGQGYWLVASDGGIFAFGDAPFYGSTGGEAPPYPITAMAPSYPGGGYWLVDANGQVFGFGNASDEGQPADAPGGYRITGMAGSSGGDGYWLASANGNVATEGDATPYGSLYGDSLNAPIVGMATTFDDQGYWLQGADGGIFCFGDAQFFGSMGGQHLNAPMVGVASR